MTKIRVQMAQAVTLAKLFDTKDVDWALGHAAVLARFAEADLASILDHHQHAGSGTRNAAVSHAGEDGSLTQGTASWAALVAAPTPAPTSTSETSTASASGGAPAVTVSNPRPEVTS